MRKNKALFIVTYSLVLLCILAIVLIADQTITVMSDAEVNSRHVLIIDAGHGGVDGGAVSCTGVAESTINLEIALRFNDLMHLLGYDTKMVRTTDVSVYTQGETIAAKKISDLKARVALINSTPRAVLISIHQNYFSQSQYSGAQVFYPSTPGSKELAMRLQDNLCHFLNTGSKRQAKQAKGVYLMDNINCPGILIECGFLSNPEEEAKLRSQAYQLQLCMVIAASVGDFLS